MSSSTLYPTFVAFCCFYVVSGVYNGDKADIASFKYVVGIQVDSLLLDTYYCTGGIIHPRFILTAAHCFTKATRKKDILSPRVYTYNLVRVYAGTKSLSKLSRGAITRKVRNIHFLESHLEEGAHDVAVAELSTELVIRGNMAKLELPEANSLVRIGLKLQIAGFGFDEFAKKNAPFLKSKIHDFQGRLKKLRAMTVSPSNCQDYYDIDSGISREDYQRKFLCTVSYKTGTSAGQPIGTGQGDSGAPIVQLKSKKETNPFEPIEKIIGVVNQGPGGDSRSSPELHANVAYYVDRLINPTITKVSPLEGGIVSEPTLFNHCIDKLTSVVPSLG